jgi:hypothetical protein
VQVVPRAVVSLGADLERADLRKPEAREEGPMLGDSGADLAGDLLL